MPAVVLMKVFESIPVRYDLGMQWITFGRIAHLHQVILDEIPASAHVLDIGCGTGDLTLKVAKLNTEVSGIDTSAEMIRLARRRAYKEGLTKSVDIKQGTALELDSLFHAGHFDAIVISFVMSQLTADEQEWVLGQSLRILKPNGKVLIADEFWPETYHVLIPYFLSRLVLHLSAFLYTHIKALRAPNGWWKLYYVVVELPLMLLSFIVADPLTLPLRVKRLRLPFGLQLKKNSGLLGGSLRVLTITKA